MTAGTEQEEYNEGFQMKNIGIIWDGDRAGTKVGAHRPQWDRLLTWPLDPSTVKSTAPFLVNTDAKDEQSRKFSRCFNMAARKRGWIVIRQFEKQGESCAANGYTRATLAPVMAAVALLADTCDSVVIHSNSVELQLIISKIAQYHPATRFIVACTNHSPSVNNNVEFIQAPEGERSEGGASDIPVYSLRDIRRHLLRKFDERTLSPGIVVDYANVREWPNYLNGGRYFSCAPSAIASFGDGYTPQEKLKFYVHPIRFPDSSGGRSNIHYNIKSSGFTLVKCGGYDKDKQWKAFDDGMIGYLLMRCGIRARNVILWSGDKDYEPVAWLLNKVFNEAVVKRIAPNRVTSKQTIDSKYSVFIPFEKVVSLELIHIPERQLPFLRPQRPNFNNSGPGRVRNKRREYNQVREVYERRVELIKIELVKEIRGDGESPPQKVSSIGGGGQ
jgi:hypothetical protein